MKENKQKHKENGVSFEEELEIFGEHKTREQVRAEEKERQKKEREAFKQEMERRRKEAKEGGLPARRKDILTVSAVLVGIVLLCVLALANSFSRAKEAKEWEINEARGHHTSSDTTPDMSSEEARAKVQEAYFTNNGHLCVELNISNGTDRMRKIESIDVAVYDDATNELIAGGKGPVEDLVIEVASVEYYTFYISPEHVQLAEGASLPEQLRFEVYTESSPVEAD